MRQPVLYPIPVWVVWVLAVPLVCLTAGIALVATTDIGDLPFDNAYLWWLGALVPVASLLFLYGVWRRRRAMAAFASEELTTVLAVRVNPGRAAIRAGLVVLAIVFVFAAILGPRWGLYLEKQRIHGVDVVVALDVSRSMLAEDISPNRLEAAKREIRRQLIERPVFRRAARLALLAFAGSTSLRVPLTTDHLAFDAKLDLVHVGSVPRGGTALGEAIRAAVDLFARSPQEATRVVLLFTDGEDHEGGPLEAAAAAYREQGVRIFTVGVGDAARSAGALVPGGAANEVKPLLYDGQIVFSKLQDEQLRAMAEAGGGQYAPVQELHRLVNAISGMWKTELTTEERQRHVPRYQWFVAAALLLLGLETIMAGPRGGDARSVRRLWAAEEAA